MGLLAQPGSYPLLVNTRAYVPGRLDTRAGIVVVNSNSLGAMVHSLKRINDPLPGAANSYAIVVGAGGNLWIGKVQSTPSAFTMIDTGYSGNPLGFVPYRPPQSPESWLYISDSLQMRKVRSDGLVYPQGIAPPLSAPNVDFAQPLATIIDDFNEADVGSWVAGGTASGLTANPGARVTDSLFTPFPTSSPGFSAVGWVPYIEDSGLPLNSGYGRGMRLHIQEGSPDVEDVIVSGIYPSKLNTTIQAIQYDGGFAAGPCCIVPVSPSTLVNNLVLRGLLSKLSRDWSQPFTAGANLQIQPNAIISIGASPFVEDVMVLSSTPGPLGTFSIRTSTKNIHVAGEPMTSVSSLRTYDTKIHPQTIAVMAGYFEASVASGIGTISNQVLAVDLSVIGTRPTQPSDEIHLSVRLDVPSNLIEGRIYLDVDSSVHDFTQNYYYASFQASQLTPAVASTSTTQAAVASSISNAQIDQYNANNPGGYYQQVIGVSSPIDPNTLPSASVQAGTGVAQWTELFIPLSNLIRVGTDTSRTLANVQGVKIYFNVSGTTVCDIHGLYLKGSYGPDVGTVGNDYYYRWRHRSTMTGAMSNPSPYIRSGLRPHGQRIAITMPGDSTEGDQFDVFRWGGSIVTAAADGTIPWFLVGSATNPGPALPHGQWEPPYPTPDVIFYDDFADSDIANAEVLEFDNQQPYSSIDIPRSGTCLVIGTSVLWQSGDLFNTSWAPGSLIEINGVQYTLYAQPASPYFLQIVESATTLGAGSQISQTFRPSSYQESIPGQWGGTPPLAYDSNLVTAATLVAFPGSSGTCRWVIDVPAGVGSFISAALNFWQTIYDPALNPSSFVEIDYSFDGGTTWATVVKTNQQGSVGSPVKTAVSLDLTGVSQIWFRAWVYCDPADAQRIEFYLNEVNLSVTYSPGVLTPAPFIVRQPTIMAVPMYAQWGPFLGYMQAVGDPYQPGVLHATKPNNPDSSSDLLDVEITPPTEPLINGCMYGNAGSFVWSNQRLFQLAASSDMGLQFTPTGAANPSVPFVPQEVPGAPGLFAKWFFCVADRIYYGTATGIVATSGGPPTSITDPYLSLLFPHDGQPGETITLGSATFDPPDMTQPQFLRLFAERDHIKFCYVDINGLHQTIVYSLVLGVWSQDLFQITTRFLPTDPKIACAYAQEGQSVNSNLVGGLNFVYQELGPLEANNDAGWMVQMAQVGDFPVGYIHGRDGYLGLMSVAPVNLIVNADGKDYSQVVPATGGGYSKQYVPLPPFKGKVLEWAVTSATSARLFLKDTFMNLKPWAGDKFQAFQPFRDLNRETQK